jgi:hypothetical protein
MDWLLKGLGPIGAALFVLAILWIWKRPSKLQKVIKEEAQGDKTEQDFFRLVMDVNTQGKINKHDLERLMKLAEDMAKRLDDLENKQPPEEKS